MITFSKRKSVLYCWLIACGCVTIVAVASDSGDGTTNRYVTEVSSSEVTPEDTTIAEHANTSLSSESTGTPFSILYANSRDIRQVKVGTGEDLRVLSDLRRTVAIDYNYATGTLVWVDTDAKGVFSGNIETGQQIQEFVAGQRTISYGIAFDWIHNNIYWTDTGNNKICVAPLNKHFYKTLFNRQLDEPRAIVLNPSEGFMFFSDWGEDPKVERCSMDGSSRKTILQRSDNIKWPNGLGIDLQERRIFWIDGSTRVLGSSDYDGNNKRTILSGSSSLNHPFALDVFRDKVYWVEWAMGEECIFSADKNTGKNITQVLKGAVTLMGIKVYHPEKQPPGPNLCEVDDAGCSHFCFPIPGVNEGSATHTCACPDGMVLSNDSRNCVEPVTKPATTTTTIATTTAVPTNVSSTDHPLLLYANTVDLRTIDLVTNEDILLVDAFDKTTVVDFHYEKKLVFFSDVKKEGIYSAPLERQASTTRLMGSNAKAYGIAIDWIHDKIYWTERNQNKLCVSQLDGRRRKTLFNTDFYEPRSLVLNPLEGWMYFLVGGVRRLERAGMDGSQRSIIVQDNVKLSNGLAIDLPARKLYWASGSTETMYSCNYDGSSVKTILSSSVYLQLPYQVDTLDSKLIWTEFMFGVETIYKADKLTGKSVTKIVQGVWPKLHGIKVYHHSKQQPGTNRCGENNGGCSSLCLAAPDSSAPYSCVCSDDDNCPESTTYITVRIIVESTTSTDVAGWETTSPSFESTEAPETLPTSTVSVTSVPDTFGNDTMHSSERTGQSSGATAGTVIGVMASLVLVAVIGFFGYRYYFHKSPGLSFFNPVYRKQTDEELVLERGEVAYSKLSDSVTPERL